MRTAAVVSPHPPLNGVTRREDGHNYEMVYAPEVSSTSPARQGEVRVRGLGNGVGPDWGTGACLLGPRARRARRAWGNRKVLWGRCKL